MQEHSKHPPGYATDLNRDVTFQNCTDDDNRVVLKTVDQYKSDYVNASYVDVSTHRLA